MRNEVTISQDGANWLVTVYTANYAPIITFKTTDEALAFARRVLTLPADASEVEIGPGFMLVLK